MQTKLIYLCMLILLNGCYNQDHRQGRKKNITVTKNTKEDEIKILAEILSYSDSKNSKGIGIEGRENNVYMAFEQLNAIASDSAWLRLSYSESPVLKCYAYDALLSRNKQMAAQVKERFKNDSSTFSSHSGCIKMTLSVSQYVSFKE